MVQFFKGSADPRDAAYGQLASALGKGLGNGLTNYFINRSLESVLHDKALEGAPQSEKMEAMYSALSPYGEKGQEFFKQRLEIEQQKTQEKETLKQEALQKKKGKALGRYLNGESLTPDEQSLFTPAEFVAIHKAKNPKSTGGLSAQAVPPEVSQKINQILQSMPDASADELENAIDQAGIPPIYKKGYIENRRRAQQTGTEHDIKFHQESAEFEKSLNTHASTAKNQLPLIENGIKSVSEGKIKPGSMANVFSYFGATGKKIANSLLSGDESALLASIPEFLEGRKELFGIRLSDADLKLLQDKLPDIGKSKEANLAILNLMKKAANKAIKLQKVAGNVLEKKGLSYRSGKLRPLGYERDVMNAFEDFERNEGTFEQVPPPAENKGKLIEDDSGKRFRSNGINWEPI
jgi:hypothetical protein